MNFPAGILVFVIVSAASKPENKTCPILDGPHRYLPVPEAMVTQKESVCGKLYSKSSCCSPETLEDIERNDTQILYKAYKLLTQPVSEECGTALMQYACLNECSPDLIRIPYYRGTLYELPVCRSSCDWLFSQCRQDLTCTDKWGKFFDDDNFYCSNQNDSPPYETGSLLGKFKTADKFCSALNGSLKIIYEEEDCFNLQTGRYIEQKNRSTDSTPYNIFTYMGLTVIAIMLCLAIFYGVTYVLKKHRITRIL